MYVLSISTESGLPLCNNTQKNVRLQHLLPGKFFMQKEHINIAISSKIVKGSAGKKPHTHTRTEPITQNILIAHSNHFQDHSDNPGLTASH